MAGRILEVYLHDRKIGILTDNEGYLNFKYLSGAVAPLSVRMPVLEEAYNDRECRPFFENLLPEGNIRASVARKEKISEENVFSLLDKIGGDCAGAVSLYEEGTKPAYNEIRQPIKISENELSKIIETQGNSPLLTGGHIRLSLAGAQRKFAVYMNDDEICYPNDVYFSSHLIKPESADFKELTVNEYFCMKLAKSMGIIVPEVVLKLLNGRPYLMIDRYDRTVRAAERKRVHQEDLCQVLGYTPDRKYQKEGGPDLKKCIGFIKEKAGIASLERFVSLLVFNYLIGNCDAHSKNFSILHDVGNICFKDDKLHAAEKKGAFVLAPFYDLVSTDIYDHVSKEMAMKIGTAWDIREVQRSDFYKMVLENGIKKKTIDGIVIGFSSINIEALKVMEKMKKAGFKTELCMEITDRMIKRLNKLSTS
jgi:serine/threonine-protein kinase HipA